MNPPDNPGDPRPRHPRVVGRRWPVSLIWLVPIVAALVGASLLLHAWLSIGPRIAISFQSAAGLEAGKTPVKFKDVTIGTVTAIELSGDRSHVIATVELDKSAASIARADTRFWVVRPRIGAGGISGIDTLLSGAYIGVDTGKSAAPRKEFDGLESPPTVINGTPGKSFVLHSEDLGSLDIGSPVYYRRIQVGRVAAYKLDADGRGVTLQVFIDAPHDSFVTRGTRFWNASGVDLTLSADGLKLNTQSLATVVAGGIAFATPFGVDRTAAPDQAQFTLAKDQQIALAPPDGPPQFMRMRFNQSLRGLVVNAPVEFFGINIGHVIAINLDYDPAKRRFAAIVDAIVYPRHLGRVSEQLGQPDGEQQQAAQFVRGMVEQGLRAQARTGNILTGQLYVALDFVRNAPAVDFDIGARPLNMPTVAGGFDKLQEQVASIVAKVEKVPFDTIGRHLDEDLGELNKTLKQVNGQMLPDVRNTLQEAQRTLGAANQALGADAPLQQNLNQTLQELQRSARSLRDLTDLLGRHPEALIRGRPADPAPAPIPAPIPAHAPRPVTPTPSTPAQEPQR